MTFQPLIPTVLTPVAVSVLPDPATGILVVAEALQPDLAQGFQIDALRLRLEMERAFGGSDAMGAWDWKLAYEAGEVALVLLAEIRPRAFRPGWLACMRCCRSSPRASCGPPLEEMERFATPLPMGPFLARRSLPATWSSSLRPGPGFWRSSPKSRAAASR